MTTATSTPSARTPHGACRGCGGPLASRRHFERLGVLEHVGYGLCRDCAQLRHEVALSVRATEWMNRAACRGSDPRLFYACTDGRGTLARMDTELALSMCQDCPVRTQCLELAMDVHDTWAVMGGTTPYTRGVKVDRRKTS
jgi:Transcription factor WhiB